jgi:hypothetical protein
MTFDRSLALIAGAKGCRGLMNLTAHLRSVITPPGVLVQA